MLAGTTYSTEELTAKENTFRVLGNGVGGTRFGRGYRVTVESGTSELVRPLTHYCWCSTCENHERIDIFNISYLLDSLSTEVLHSDKCCLSPFLTVELVHLQSTSGCPSVELVTCNIICSYQLKGKIQSTFNLLHEVLQSSP